MRDDRRNRSRASPETPLCVVHLTSSETLSGGARQALLLAGGLGRRGHRVVFCAPAGSAVLAEATSQGLEVVPLSAGSLWGQWKASRRLRAVVRKEGADLVHSHHTKGHNVALFATFGGAFPPVVANRGVVFRPRFPAKFRSRRTGAVVTNSSAVKAVLEKSGVSEAKVHVVYNVARVPPVGEWEGLLPGLREELGLAGSAPVIGAVGGARPEKGFQFLVEAAPRILADHPGARFVLVGSGVERFSARLWELGVEHAFRLPGYREDAVRIMALFSLFVIPSVGMESCPNVLLEAMSLGLPAVGADTGGIGEVIVDGTTGRVVPRGSAEALAGAVLEVLGDPGRAARWGAAGADRAAAEFSLEAKVSKTLRVYEEVLGL